LTRPNMPAAGSASTQLDELLRMLCDLRRKVLSPSSSEYPELPVADVRLLHKEFTDRSLRLEQIRNELCPPTKFVFRRYRAAMQRHKQKKQKQQSSPPLLLGQNSKATEETENEKNEKPISMGTVIEKLEMARVVEQANGTIIIFVTEEEQSRTLNHSSSDGSLTIRDLQGCHVSLHAPHKALHIINVADSTIQLETNIEGAIHITACREMELHHGHCHQLRIHESHDLRISVKTQSGPILEDSCSIQFVVHPLDQTSRDVKDFSWLRSGLPSPNFTVILREDEPKRIGESLSKQTGNQATNSSKLDSSEGGTEEALAPNAPEDDDDEDEL